MRKSFFSLCVLLIFTMSLAGVVTAEVKTVTVKGLQFWGYPFVDLEEGNTVQWDVSSSTECGRKGIGGEEFDLYLTTSDEYQKAMGIGAMAYNDPPAWESAWTAYVAHQEITQHKDTFKVPSAGSWVLFIRTSGGCTIEFSYDISVSEEAPGFTLLPTMMGLGLLGTVVAIRKYRKPRR